MDIHWAGEVPRKLTRLASSLRGRHSPNALTKVVIFFLGSGLARASIMGFRGLEKKRIIYPNQKGRINNQSWLQCPLIMDNREIKLLNVSFEVHLPKQRHLQQANWKSESVKQVVKRNTWRSKINTSDQIGGSGAAGESSNFSSSSPSISASCGIIWWNSIPGGIT